MFGIRLSEKGIDLTQPFDKITNTDRKLKKEVKTQNVTKMIDYTAIADRLRTIKQQPLNLCG